MGQGLFEKQIHKEIFPLQELFLTNAENERLYKPDPHGVMYRIPSAKAEDQLLLEIVGAPIILITLMFMFDAVMDAFLPTYTILQLALQIISLVVLVAVVLRFGQISQAYRSWCARSKGWAEYQGAVQPRAIFRKAGDQPNFITGLNGEYLVRPHALLKRDILFQAPTLEMQEEVKRRAKRFLLTAGMSIGLVVIAYVAWRIANVDIYGKAHGSLPMLFLLVLIGEMLHGQYVESVCKKLGFARFERQDAVYWP